MKVIVFTDPEPNNVDSAIISKLEDGGVKVLVDSIHKTDINWIVANYMNAPHRVYYAESTELYDGIVKELDEKSPFNFIAHFNNNDSINNADWVYIKLYFKAILYGDKMPRLTRRLTNMLDDLYTEKITIQQENHDMQSDQPEACYSFKKAIFEDRNIALCEIVKPIFVKCQDKIGEKMIVETSVPYTIVIRNFATRGFYPAFWSLFICDSWGKDNRDVQFLKALWDDLKMGGEFDMDAIIENGIKECNWGNGEGACAGPEVYRKGLADTLDTLLEKEKGCRFE
jgi:hypothetical protein